MIVLQALIVFSVTRILAAQNDRPIIGIAAQEFGLLPSLRKFHSDHSSTSYIVASYVKAVESSGARVVPILTNRDESYYRHLLGSINGVLLPGGACLSGPGHPYYDAVTMIYKIASEMNDKGLVFPILGVCLGYEFLITVANNHKSFLTSCNIDYENLSLKLTLPPSQTALFADADERLLRTLKSDDLTVNHHQWCALEKDFNNSSLPKDWLITSLSTPKSGIEFIASVEHDLFPFLGIQFHPEKVAFEWNETFMFPHSRDAVIASRLFYDTFVKFSKQNFNRFRWTEEERKALIYNYQAVVHGTEFEQIYLF